MEITEKTERESVTLYIHKGINKYTTNKKQRRYVSDELKVIPVLKKKKKRKKRKMNETGKERQRYRDKEI